MKSSRKAKRLLLLAMFTLSPIIVLTVTIPVLAHNVVGTTTIAFSPNPAILSGDSDPDVTITTTTTAASHGDAVDEGSVRIHLATDGSPFYNPVPFADVVEWVNLSGSGENPVSGIATFDVDLDALGFDCGTVGGFRAHYVTGGGSHHVNTHFSQEVDLTAECECQCDETETAFAYDETLGTCFIDIPELTSNRWGWTIGPLAAADGEEEDGLYDFPIYAAAGQCDTSKGMLVGQLFVSYVDGTATVTYVMDSCRILTETHLYVGSDPVPTGPSGDLTVAPGQYGNIHDEEDAPNAEFDEYEITGLSGDIYLIAHAVVCVEPEPEDEE